MSNFNQRLHALDNLRAILALLGIPFHVAFLLFLSYNPASFDHYSFQLNQLIISAPSQYSFVFFSAFFIHIFRMPTFFLLAGFFAHLLYEKAGTQHFLKNRLMRIGLPLLFFMLWLIPSYLNTVLLLAAKQKIHTDFSTVFIQVIKQHYHDGDLFRYFNNTREFWFLYDLLWFYLFTLALIFIKSTLLCNSASKQKFNQNLQKIILSNKIFFWFPILCSLLLFGSKSWYANLDTSLIPTFPLLLFYSFWYFLGWWLWLHKQDFIWFGQQAWLKLIIALALYPGYLISYFYFINKENLLAQYFTIVLYCLIMTMSIFAVLGLTWRYLNRAQFILKYISEAAYWIYLVQMPILLVLMPMLALTKQNFYSQFLVATLGCMLICVITYHIFVRYTWLGKILGNDIRR